MAIQNYIGINGLVTQSLEEIIDDLTAKYKAIYGNDINIEQNSPDGQFINIIAQEKKDILDLITQIYNNLDTDRVIGIPQQILYKLNGLVIKAYTYSYCYVNVTCTQPVNLNGLDDNIESEDGVGYTVTDTNGNRWILAESQSLQAGTHLLNFRAAELGQITSLPNTITIMETILAGVSGVNNPANNYITGQKGESDSEYRTRRNKSLSIPSQGFEDSIEGQLLNLTNVNQVKIYSNRDNFVVDTIPPHTLWVIVEGGDSEEIAKIIYNNIPPGIPMKGEQSVQVAKPNGNLITINYDLPTAEDLYVDVKIKLLYGDIDENYIKEELAKLTFDIGQIAESVNIATTIKNLIGETGSPYDIEISKDGIEYSSTILPTGLDNYFTIKVENINLTVTN